MSKYLLTCGCGKTVPVDVGQAGGQIACSCGNQLDVPALRQLRQLPQEKVAEAVARSTWGTRQGWITVTLIATGILLAWSAWTWWNQPVQPKFVVEEHMADVDRFLKQMKPVDAWERWVGFYRPLSERGLRMLHAYNAAEIHQKIIDTRFFRGVLLALAAIFAATSAAIAFWPRSGAGKKTGRGRDGETGMKA
jgi:hypothetical protein